MSNNTIHYHGGADLCHANFQGSAALCAKTIIFAVLAFITALCCLWKSVRLIQGSSVEKYHLFAMLLAFAECIVLGIHWVYVGRTELHFTALYLLVNEFLVMCAFYGGLAVKIYHNKKLLERIYYPAAFIIFFYFTAVLGYSFSDVSPDRVECTKPQWLLFSASQFTLAQLMLGAGVLLTNVMNNAQLTDKKFLASKKMMLWSLVIAFEMSAIYNFSFDLALKFDTSNNHCDDVFGPPDSAEYIFVTWLQWTIGYLLPVWVMLVVIKPTIKNRDVQRANIVKRLSNFEFDHTEEDQDNLHPLEERLVEHTDSRDWSVS